MNAGRRQAEPAGRADRRAGHRTAAQSGQQRRRQRRAGAPRAGGHADGSPRHQPRAVPQHPQRREGLPTPQPAPDQAAVADPVSDCDQSLRHHGRQEVRRSARARHAVSGADLPEFEGENATGGTSTRASSGCWTTCWPTATKSAGDLRQGRHRAAAGADAARA